jgi:hypothetical protein
MRIMTSNDSTTYIVVGGWTVFHPLIVHGGDAEQDIYIFVKFIYQIIQSGAFNCM